MCECIREERCLFTKCFCAVCLRRHFHCLQIVHPSSSRSSGATRKSVFIPPVPQKVLHHRFYRPWKSSVSPEASTTSITKIPRTKGEWYYLLLVVYTTTTGWLVVGIARFPRYPEQSYNSVWMLCVFCRDLQFFKEFFLECLQNFLQQFPQVFRKKFLWKFSRKPSFWKM